MRKSILLILSFLLSSIVFAQITCISGGMSIYSECNNGQGCTGGCDLTEFSWFGPMCNCTLFSGNCFGANGSGGQQVKSTIISIPTSCSSTLSASFRQRCNGNGCVNCGTNCSNNASNCSSGTGCGNSGLDNGDNFSIEGSSAPTSTNLVTHSGSPSYSQSGNKFTVTGSTNSGATLSYAMSSGGTYTLSMSSNRSDEIVTFTLIVNSGCDCNQVLPVDLVDFIAIPENAYVSLKWMVKNEKHLSHYRLEKSIDGYNFELLGNVPSENSMREKLYTFIDDNPYEGISYYKLTVINTNNEEEKFILRDVLVQYEYRPFTYEIKENNIFFYFVNTESSNSYFQLVDISGKKILQIFPINQVEYVYPLSIFSSGFYVGIYFDGKRYFKSKVVIVK